MELTEKDFRMPMSSAGQKKVRAIVNRKVGYQATAASANVLLVSEGTNPAVLQDGVVIDVFAIFPVVPASGESLVVDVQKSVNGGTSFATILTGTQTFNSTNVTSTTIRKQFSFASKLDPSKTSVKAGDQLRAVLTYAAGGGPTPILGNIVGANIG
jgi:hypothetical protein